MTAQDFRKRHLLELLERFDPGRGPLDKSIHYYYKTHKALGSKDRGAITEDIYALIRLKLLLEHVVTRNGVQASWENLYEAFLRKQYIQAACDPFFPDYVQVSMPFVLFNELVASYGRKEAEIIAKACNEPAPTTIRVNTLKISREGLFRLFQSEGFSVSLDEAVATAIHFGKKEALFSLESFQKGYFEVQDAASQAIAQKLQPRRHERVLDFCAGAGGKTLAFAPSLENTGQIYLHDIRKEALFEARKRLKRAGIQNAQIIHSEEIEKLQKLKKQMDWVFVDVPCSGTGTMRRNPDMKWRFTEKMLQELLGKQRTIFEQALSYVRPQGRIIYATCSVLNKENEDQVAHFLKKYPIEQEGVVFKNIPSTGKPDGFFSVVFKKK